jgi:hypothetical protein
MVNQRGLKKVTKIDAGVVRNLATELVLQNAFILQKGQSKIVKLNHLAVSYTFFTLCLYAFILHCFRKKRGSAAANFEPLVVENGWPTKKPRLNGCTRKSYVHDLTLEDGLDISDVVVHMEAVSGGNADVGTEKVHELVVQCHSVEEVQDMGEQAHAVEEVQDMGEQAHAVEEVQDMGEQAHAVEEVQDMVQVMKVRRPRCRDAKKTKSMKLLCPVPAEPNIKKMKKSKAKKTVV